MKKASKVGLWTMCASLVAGVLAVLMVGPRKIKEGLTHFRGKPEMKEIEVDGP